MLIDTTNPEPTPQELERLREVVRRFQVQAKRLAEMPAQQLERMALHGWVLSNVSNSKTDSVFLMVVRDDQYGEALLSYLESLPPEMEAVAIEVVRQWGVSLIRRSGAAAQEVKGAVTAACEKVVQELEAASSRRH